MKLDLKKISAVGALLAVFVYAATVCLTHGSNNILAEKLQINGQQLGLLFSLTYVGFLISCFISGLFVDKKGKLPAILLGIILMLIGGVLFFLTNTYLLAVIAMLVIGLGGGLGETHGTGYIGDIYTGAKRVQMVNLTQTFFGAGAFFGPLLITALLFLNGQIIFSFYIVCIFAIIGIVCAYISIKKKQEKPVGASVEKVPWKKILGDKMIYIIMLSLILYCGGELGFSGWVARYSERYLNLSKVIAPIFVGVFWLGICLGSVAFGFLAKKFTPHNLIKLSLLYVMPSFVIFFIKSPICAIIGTFLIGFFFGPTFPVLVGIGSERHKEHSGKVNSMLFIGGVAGGLIFPYVMGVVVDFLDIKSAIALSLILSIINLIVVTFFIKEK